MDPAAETPAPAAPPAPAPAAPAAPKRKLSGGTSAEEGEEAQDTKKTKTLTSPAEELLNVGGEATKTKTVGGGIGIETKLKTCVHYVSLPKGMEEATELVDPIKPAREWDFVLDEFQRKSCQILEARQSLLVAAHTSAGKTLVGEYAISLAMAKGSRVIYTSPIKALSNQKYRELKEYYDEVGLMTGDVNLNPNAPCLVMTTEILRNMMVRGNEILTSVSWIIFDEVHYMRDRERGVVWEESIILINPSINLVFLSATLSNPNTFADWVTNLKQKPCHVVTTDYRPTPLMHYVFTAGGAGLFLVVDEHSNFLSDNFNDAAAVSSGISDGKGNSDLYRIVSLAEESKWLPMIVFTFSRRECEWRALQLQKIDLNTVEEKAMVKQVFENALESLLEVDRDIPQLQTCLPLLLRGIGVHHSGLLPIVKEVVEILFSESLIKVLFATETFAMGVNMPAKTVVFSGTQKFDGKSFRNLSSGEYTQMSGRAGRRGTDKHGICILMIDDGAAMEDLQEIVLGQADPLVSRFKMSYTMILNTMRADSILSTEELINLSLHQHQYLKDKPQEKPEERKLKALTKQGGDQDLESFVKMQQMLEGMLGALRTQTQAPDICLPFLQAGRCVHIRDQHEDYGWGVVVNWRKKFAPDTYLIDVLLPLKSLEMHGQLPMPMPCLRETHSVLRQCGGFAGVLGAGRQAELPQLHVVSVAVSMLWTISSVRIYMPSDLRGLMAKAMVYDTMLDAQKNFPFRAFPPLEPQDLGLATPQNEKDLKRIRSLQRRISSHKANKVPAEKREKFLELYNKRAELAKKLQDESKTETQSHLEEFKIELNKRLRVLRRLGHIDEQGVQLQKGKVACEVESVDELLVTECIFEGLFNELTPAQICAVLSCMFPQDKTRRIVTAAPELDAALEKMKVLALRVATVQKDCLLPIEPEQYVQSFQTGMMQLTFEWCSGKPFPEVTALTDMFEGTIIRLLRRLEELLRELSAAAASIGNSELQKQFDEGSKLLKRGIVFANSLYV